MSDTYSKIYIQVVFAVKNRDKLLHISWRQEVFKYIAGIVNAKGHKCYIVNGVEDHVHLLISIKPSLSISDLVRDVKNNSSNYINDRKFLKLKFSWQAGYAVFSYSADVINLVYNYIQNQEAHHKKITFQSEYEKFIEEFPFE
jgi:REP element-mobilizing transposase RayT